MPQKMEIDLDSKELTAIGKALSSEARIEILRLLLENQLNINEIAEILKIPQSSAAVHIKVLEKAGLIATRLHPAARGSMKICSVDREQIVLDMKTNQIMSKKTEVISMPIGHFVDYKVKPTCGIAGVRGMIGEEDEPRCFFEPNRVNAQLIWFGRGYLEYRFPNPFRRGVKAKCLELSMEICSEDHEYNMECPSDISIWINQKKVGTWTCPSDFGGRRGKLNPDWWPDKNTQYGILKTWKLTTDGSYLDGEKTGDVPISAYKLLKDPYITVKIGVDASAENIGGVNLFGENFGDYPQNILMKIVYE